MGERRFHRWLKRRSKLRAAKRRQNLRARAAARLIFEPLEGRILLSAVPVGGITDVFDGDTSSIANLIASPIAGVNTEAIVERHPSTSPTPEVSSKPWSEILASWAPLSQRREIVFVDTSVESYQTLIEGIDPSAEVFLLDSARDGIEQIAEVLQGRTGIDAVHVISHGDAGELRLGTGRLTLGSMVNQYADELANINQALSHGADFLIYGCNFGQGQAGQAAAARLAQLTGADIAASTDLTGSAALGGDWDLELSTGHIEAGAVFSVEARRGFMAVLDITTGLTGHWTLDADATDSSGNGYNGTLTNGAMIDTASNTNQVGAGKLSFDGVNDYDDLSAHIAGFSGLTEGTISFWVKTTDAGDNSIFTVSDSGDANSFFTAGVSGGNLFFRVDEAGSTLVEVDGAAIVNDGTWHHLAVTVDGTGNKLFVDGIQETGGDLTYLTGNTGTTSFFDDVTSLDAMQIGVRESSGFLWYFDGLADDVRVYNRALAAADIAELAAEAPVAVDDSATTAVDTAVMIDVEANDTDLDSETITVLDVGNPTNGTVVNNGDGTVTYTPNLSYAGADSFDYITADLDDTVSYWRLDGNGTDAVGSNNGTLTGTTTVTGRFGDALSFDEIDDKVQITDFAFNDEFSVSFRFKIDDNTGSTFQYIYSHGTVAATNSLNIFVNESSHGTDPDKLRTVIADSTETGDNVALEFDVSAIIGDGNWHTYTLTVASGVGSVVYLDGVQQNSDTRGGDSFNPTTDVYLGAREDLNADRFYGGELDSVQVFNRALSDAQVSDLHNGDPLGTVNLLVGNLTVDTTSDVSDGDTSNIANLVASKGADGFISLREAITAANNTAGTDTIEFNIAGAGPHTITPGSALPDITDAVIIDGTSEPDFSGTPIIELDGSGAGAGVDGLRLVAGSDGSTIQGLVINQFDDEGIEVNNSDSNIILGNYIGTDVTGTVNLGNGDSGILLRATATNTLVGGTTAGARNIISGNQNTGIWIDDSDSNTIEGNYIGTDVTGTVAVGNTNNGIVIITGSDNNIIGGITASARNIISGNGDDGIDVLSGVNTVIQGNYIGTDVTGTVDVGNAAIGIKLRATATSTLVGGTTDGARNIISGNNSDGVLIDNSTGTTVAGNYIGTDVTGTVDLGNSFNGVRVRGGASSNTIGGVALGAGNLIAYNSQDGVLIEDGTSLNNALLGNAIHSNTNSGDRSE